MDPGGGLASIPDMVQNILLFIPFGFLAFIALGSRLNATARIAITTVAAFLFSLNIEILQLLTPKRVTSATDLSTNTIGGLLGALAAFAAIRAVRAYLRHPRTPVFRPQFDFYALLCFTLVAVLGMCEPFDFSLDIGSGFSGVKYFLAHPWGFSLPSDEFVAALRFTLVAFFAARVCGIIGRQGGPGDFPPTLVKICGAYPLRTAFLSTGIFGTGLEALQFIIASRSPSGEDVLYILLGALLGVLLVKAVPEGLTFADRKGAALGFAVIFTAAVTVEALYPFRWAEVPASLNWLPFWAHYERTGFDTAGNFLQSLIRYFPCGFLVMLASRSQSRWFFLSVGGGLLFTLVLSLGLESAQGYVAGRYPDVTDVIGALLGCSAGIFLAGRGYAAFRGLFPTREGA